MSFRKSESGNVLVLTAMCLTILMGFVAMAIDVGMLFHARLTDADCGRRSRRRRRARLQVRRIDKSTKRCDYSRNTERNAVDRLSYDQRSADEWLSQGSRIH